MGRKHSSSNKKRRTSKSPTISNDERATRLLTLSFNAAELEIEDTPIKAPPSSRFSAFLAAEAGLMYFDDDPE